MTNTPSITTIIPTYRRPDLLQRAIRSVLMQSYPIFEVHVCDNASGDKTSSVVKRFVDDDPRVKYFVHRENIGPFQNFQSGLARVTTPYFSFLSDDDFLLPNFYETTLLGFDKFPEIGFSAGSVVVMSERGEVLHVPFTLWERDGYFAAPEGVLNTVGRRYPTWTGVLFRKSAAEEVGGLDPEVGMFDLDFVYRVAAHHSFVTSKQPSAVCVSHRSSWSQIMEFGAVWPGGLKMIRNVTEDISLPMDVRKRFEAMALRDLGLMVFWVGVKAVERGRYEQAREAATVLEKHLKWLKRSQIIALMASVCKRSLFMHRLFSRSFNIARRGVGLLRRDRRNLQKEYGHLSSWLTGSTAEQN